MTDLPGDLIEFMIDHFSGHPKLFAEMCIILTIAKDGECIKVIGRNRAFAFQHSEKTPERGGADAPARSLENLIGKQLTVPRRVYRLFKPIHHFGAQDLNHDGCNKT